MESVLVLRTPPETLPEIAWQPVARRQELAECSDRCSHLRFFREA